MKLFIRRTLALPFLIVLAVFMLPMCIVASCISWVLSGDFSHHDMDLDGVFDMIGEIWPKEPTK